MNVAQIMTRDPISVGEDTPLDIVAGLMIDNRIGCIPVTDADGGLRGIITEADFTGNERNVPFGAFVIPHLFDAAADEERLERVRTQARRPRRARSCARRPRPLGTTSRPGRWFAAWSSSSGSGFLSCGMAGWSASSADTTSCG